VQVEGRRRDVGLGEYVVDLAPVVGLVSPAKRDS
jgi:hypothetical protein